MTKQALLALLHDLSLEEKVGQLCQMDMSTFLADAGSPTGPMKDFHLTREQIVCAGSLICGGNADAKKFAQVHETIRREAPHGIPPLIMSDVIHGMRTIFPIPLALGCIFDENQTETMARVSAKEASASGIHVTFAPMADVARDPRWGRCMESVGESPALCAAMSAAMVKGFHGNGIAQQDALATCVKHFAAYGLVEAGREYAPVDVSRTEMYNTYLPPFKAALDAGCDMLMPAFTPIERVPAIANTWLMNDVLRTQWGWNGMVISDWGSTGELVIHGMAENLKEAALLSFRASMDMDMMSFAYATSLKELVEEGAISTMELDAAVWRVLTLKNNLGLFERPAKQVSTEEQMRVCHLPEHREAALQAALRSCVLLKNDGILPLRPGMKIALEGDHAASHALLGSWRADGRNEETPSLMDVLSVEKRIILVAPEEADMILYAVGECQDDTGEAASKAYPMLTDDQRMRLEQLHGLGIPVVMVLFCGRPMVLAKEAPLCSGILNAWFPGSEGAEAIRCLLMGDANPSGHLSMTFPRSVGQIPIHHDALSTGRPNTNAVRDYVSQYLDEANTPLYPFGYGLSYTTFAFGSVRLSSERLTDAAPVTVSVDVTNTGSMEGDAVAQLYFRGKHGRQLMPLRTLAGWKRISLAPGETKTVAMTLKKQQLNAYDANGCTVEAQGEYNLYIGADSTAPKMAIVTVE